MAASPPVDSPGAQRQPQPEKPPAARALTRDEGLADHIAAKPIIWTTCVCAAVAAAGHGLLWIAYSLGWNPEHDVEVPWQPVAGISLVVVAIVAFGGFYLASRRARIAIASSFLLTFLVALSFALTIDALAAATQGDAEELVDDFRSIVITIIGFYFGSEAAVSVAKVIGVTRTSHSPGDIQRADRDLVVPAPSDD